MAPTASAANRRHGQIGDLFDQREGRAGLADRHICPHAIQRQFGGAQAVHSRIAAHRRAGRFCIDHEQPDAGPIALPAGKPRGHHEFVRAVAVQHQALGAIKDVAAAVAARRYRDVGQIVARLPLDMGERQDEVAARDLRQHICSYRVAGAEPQQSAGEHHGGEIRLKRQSAAQCLHHDHGLNRPAGRPAILLVERQTEQAEFRVTLPHRAAPAAGLLSVAFSRIERIMVGEQTFDALAQQPLFVGQRKIHCQSPRIALAMMFFWISLEPP